MDKGKILYHCDRKWCKKAILQHMRGNMYRCPNCGTIKQILSTLDSHMGSKIEDEFPEEKPIGRYNPVIMDERISDKEFSKAVRAWRKKNGYAI